MLHLNKNNITFNSNRQSGVVLIVALIMLLLLTIIGSTALRVTGLEEKMAGNSKDKNVAFQAAEAALRDAENDITSSGRISGLTNMDNVCTNGLCYTGSVIKRIEDDTAKIANAVVYGTYTSAPSLSVIPASQQPRYLIEGKKTWPAGASSWKYIYKITSLAQGGQSTTTSVVQEVYGP
jgi:type IV pilus assembly protein PilX